MKNVSVTIVKDGKLININEDELRRDDVVIFQAGDIIPADLRLTEARNLEVDEFEITGEIMPVIKDIAGSDDMIFMGSRVIKGSGRGIVIAIGEQTEYGKVLEQGWEGNGGNEWRIFKMKYLYLIGLLLPVFVIELIQTGHVLGTVIFYLLLSLIIVVLQNDGLINCLIFSTVRQKIQDTGIQIRDPNALMDLNQVDIVCFDKTGVLTTRQMVVKNIYIADHVFTAQDILADNDIAHLVNVACALGNDLQFYEKIDQANHVDKALISFAIKNGVDISNLFLQYKRIYDKPFDSENRYMACGFKSNGDRVFFAKGDPDVVINQCSHYVDTDGLIKEIGFDFICLVNSIIDVVNQEGDVVISMAYAHNSSDSPPGKYIFLCLFQLENPLQPGARETISHLTAKGIRSILLTGDRAKTAVRISEDCGISKDSRTYLTGKIIDRMELAEVARQSVYCSVFVRLMPSQKGIIIRLLQQKGRHVVMVGDGPNDGIALKAANVGISLMANSSPIARRLSKILINDLTDLLKLIESAHRIRETINYIKLFKILIIILIFTGVYMRVFAL
jgi:Ca2+-transporting ATPase